MAQERRAGWKKFGEAATERAADSVTSQTPDEVPLERIQRQKQTQEEKAKVRCCVGRKAAVVVKRAAAAAAAAVVAAAAAVKECSHCAAFAAATGLC